jgi:acyl carrier protein
METRFPVTREKRLSDADSLLRSGAIDSLGILSLAQFITEELGIVLADEDLNPEDFDSIASLARLIEKKRSVA